MKPSSCFATWAKHYKVEIIEGIADETRCRCTGRATGSIYAAARMCRPPGSIKAFKLTRLPAPIGAAIRATSSCSAFTVRRGPTKQGSKELFQAYRRGQAARSSALGRHLDLFSFHPIAPRIAVFSSQRARSFTIILDPVYIAICTSVTAISEVVTPLIYKTSICGKPPAI